MEPVGSVILCRKSRNGKWIVQSRNKCVIHVPFEDIHQGLSPVYLAYANVEW